MNEIREERVAGIWKARAGPVIKPGDTTEEVQRKRQEIAAAGRQKKETTLRDMRGRLRGGREREILICGRHFRAAQHTAWLAVAGRAGKRGWRGGGHVSCHFSHHTFSAGGSDRCINVVDPREVESPAVHGFNGIPIPSSCLTPLFKKR
jgi:hypothetical protein